MDQIFSFDDYIPSCKGGIGNQEIIPSFDFGSFFSPPSFGLLSNYAGEGGGGGRFRRLNRERISETHIDKSRSRWTEEIIRLAGERFLQSSSSSSSSRRNEDLTILSHHPYGSSFMELSSDEIKEIELVHNLLVSAEKVSLQQYDRARKLLDQSDHLSSDQGTPVQRLVHYFTKALLHKIGQIGSKPNTHINLEDITMNTNPAIIAFHQDVPFSQVLQFAGMQAIVENMSNAKRVHIIELGIRTGVQLTVLMQAFAARDEPQLELLKITAVGMKPGSEIEDVGKLLMGFAESFGLPFQFNVVLVFDMFELTEDRFEVEQDEAVAVHSPFFLWTMIGRPDRLDNVMKVVTNLNPRIILVTEVEGNLNSPVFVNRFVESLFYYGVLFDSFGDCMGKNGEKRMELESECFGKAILNVVVAEGADRVIRHVSLEVWRSFLGRFGMEEVELSMASVYQAKLVAKRFACGSSCSIDLDGKCLIAGWKGTPVFSLSVWKLV